MDPPRPMISVNVQVKSCSAIALWLTISVLVQTGLDTGSKPDNLSLIFVILGSICISFIVYYKEKSILASFCRLRVSQIQQEQTFSRFIYSMCVLIERSTQANYRFELHSVIKILKDDMLQESSKLDIAEMDWIIADSCLLQNIDIRIQSYKILVDLLRKYRHRFTNTMYLGLLNSYILHTKLDLKWMAIYEVQDILSESRETRIKFSADFFVRQIEADMLESEIRDRDKTQTIDVVSLMDFQEKFANFNEQIISAYELYYEFWMQLAKIKPNVKQIKSVGTKINIINQDIKKAFDDMMEKSSNQAKTILLYGHFLRLVVNDEEEATKLITRGMNLQSSTQNNRFYIENKQLSYADNSSLSIIVASGDQRTMGQIKSFNSETLKLFEYTAEELTGANVEMLMPKIYADNHERWMRRYFETNKVTVMKSERVVHCLDSRGFIVPANIMYRIVSIQSSGILIMAVVEKLNFLDTSALLLVSPNTGQLLGVSVAAFKRYGFHPALVYGNEHCSQVVSIQQVLPEIRQPRELSDGDKFKSIRILDLGMLQTTFQIEQNYANLIDTICPRKSQETRFHITLLVFREDLSESSSEVLKITISDFNDLDKNLLRLLPLVLNSTYHAAATRRLVLTHEEVDEHQPDPESIEVVTEKYLEQEEEEESALIVQQERERRVREKMYSQGRSQYRGTIGLIWIVTMMMMTTFIAFSAKHLRIQEDGMHTIGLTFDNIVAMSVRQEGFGILTYWTRRLHLASLDMVPASNKTYTVKDSRSKVTFELTQIAVVLESLKTRQLQVDKTFTELSEIPGRKANSYKNKEFVQLDDMGNERIIKMLINEIVYSMILNGEGISHATLPEVATISNKSVVSNSRRDFYFINQNVMWRINTYLENQIFFYVNLYTQTMDAYWKSLFMNTVYLWIIYTVLSLAALQLVKRIIGVTSIVVNTLSLLSIEEASELQSKCETFEMLYISKDNQRVDGASGIHFDDQLMSPKMGLRSIGPESPTSPLKRLVIMRTHTENRNASGVDSVRGDLASTGFAAKSNSIKQLLKEDFWSQKSKSTRSKKYHINPERAKDIILEGKNHHQEYAKSKFDGLSVLDSAKNHPTMYSARSDRHEFDVRDSARTFNLARSESKDTATSELEAVRTKTMSNYREPMCFNFLKALCISTLMPFGIYYLDFGRGHYNFSNYRSMTDHVLETAMLSWEISRLTVYMQELLATSVDSDVNLLKISPIVNESIGKITNRIKNIGSKVNIALPGTFSQYQAQYNLVMESSICEHFFKVKPSLNFTSSPTLIIECENTVFNKSLLNLATIFAQNSNQMLHDIMTADDPTSKIHEIAVNSTKLPDLGMPSLNQNPSVCGLGSCFELRSTTFHLSSRLVMLAPASSGLGSSSRRRIY